MAKERIIFIPEDELKWIAPYIKVPIDAARARSKKIGDATFEQDILTVLVPAFARLAIFQPELTKKYPKFIIKNLYSFIGNYRKKNPNVGRKELVKTTDSYIIKILRYLLRRQRLTEGPKQADAPYEQLAQQLEGELLDARAAELAPALNERIQAMPHNNHDEKKELAHWVNDELRRFGLALKGPTDQPSLLVAAPGNPPDVEVGRLLLEYKTPDGKRGRTQLPAQLPHFELMEANPRREALREWHERIGRQGRGNTRA